MYPLIVACEGISDDFQMKIVMHNYTCTCVCTIDEVYFCLVNSSSSLIPLRSKPTASALPVNNNNIINTHIHITGKNNILQFHPHNAYNNIIL